MYIISKIQNWTHNGYAGNYLQAKESRAEAESAVSTFGDLDVQQIAQMSDTDLDALLATYGETGISDEYRDQFMRFSDTEQGRIVEELQKRAGGLSVEAQSKVSDIVEQDRRLRGSAGFAGTGSALGNIGGQLQNLFTSTALKKSGVQTDIAKQRGDYAESQLTAAQTALGSQIAERGEGMSTSAAEKGMYYDSDGVLRHGEGDKAGQRTYYGGNWFGGENLQRGEGSFLQPAAICVVSTALNDSGAWSDNEKLDAVKWCRDTHHDGTDRGKTWVDGYHTWGGFLAKWVEKSNIVRYVVDTTTTAFIDHTRRNKPNYLGFMIHHGWVNPLSYVIGYSRKNKILGKLATIGMVGIYSILFPLFGLASIPHIIKEKYDKYSN
mgnify:CR=1 FL=1|tara:strand:- start:18056 stop:19195 length:1140 start_codon:yes stop_codon:yes gene_type:complete